MVDAAARQAPAPPARVDLNQTSFLLSPPEWLQEAADRMGVPDRRRDGGSSSGASDGAGSRPAAAGGSQGGAAAATPSVRRGPRPGWAGGAAGREAGRACGGDAVDGDGHQRRCGRGSFGSAAGDGVRAAVGRRGRRRYAAALVRPGCGDHVDGGRQPAAAYGGRSGGGGAGGGRRARGCALVRLSAGSGWSRCSGVRLSAGSGGAPGARPAGWAAGSRSARRCAVPGGFGRVGPAARAERRGHRRCGDQQGGASSGGAVRGALRPPGEPGAPGVRPAAVPPPPPPGPGAGGYVPTQLVSQLGPDGPGVPRARVLRSRRAPLARRVCRRVRRAPPLPRRRQLPRGRRFLRGRRGCSADSGSAEHAGWYASRRCAPRGHDARRSVRPGCPAAAGRPGAPKMPSGVPGMPSGSRVRPLRVSCTTPRPCCPGRRPVGPARLRRPRGPRVCRPGFHSRCRSAAGVRVSALRAADGGARLPGRAALPRAGRFRAAADPAFGAGHSASGVADLPRAAGDERPAGPGAGAAHGAGVVRAAGGLLRADDPGELAPGADHQHRPVRHRSRLASAGHAATAGASG